MGLPLAIGLPHGADWLVIALLWVGFPVAIICLLWRIGSALLRLARASERRNDETS